MIEYVAVVDAEDRFIRWAPRHEIHDHRLVHRSIHVLLFTPDGRLWLQRRAERKRVHPGLWDVSASGHVARDDYLAGPNERLDEVYAAVAHRELREELGLETTLRAVGLFAPAAGVHYERVALFDGVAAGPPTLQREEVAEARPVAREELQELLGEPHRVTPTLPWLLDRYLPRWGWGGPPGERAT